MMEIEKKYLIDKIPEKLKLPNGINIEQGYLTSPEAQETIRLRKKGNKYYKTWKSKGLLIREEKEVELNKAEYEKEWTSVLGNTIKKTRYEIPYDSHIIELDIYHGVHNDLITAEVEFKSIEQSELFEPPNWFGKDVTLSAEFKNSNLAFNGLPENL